MRPQRRGDPTSKSYDACWVLSVFFRSELRSDLGRGRDDGVESAAPTGGGGGGLQTRGLLHGGNLCFEFGQSFQSCSSKVEVLGGTWTNYPTHFFAGLCKMNPPQKFLQAKKLPGVCCPTLFVCDDTCCGVSDCSSCVLHHGGCPRRWHYALQSQVLVGPLSGSCMLHPAP